MTEEEFQAALANAAPAAAPVAQVYLGGTGRAVPQVGPGGALVPSTAKVTETYAPTSIDRAILQFQSWSQAQMLQFQQQLKRAGIEANTVFDLQAYWEQVVTMASQSYAAYSQGVIDKPQTPEQIISVLADMGQKSGIGETDSGPTTVTSTQTTNLSASGARAQAEGAFQAELGRDPVGSQADGMATGSTSTTTTTTDKHGNTTSTTQSGANLGQLALEYARGQDDYAEYQAATTYMDAFLSSIAAVA